MLGGVRTVLITSLAETSLTRGFPFFRCRDAFLIEGHSGPNEELQ